MSVFSQGRQLAVKYWDTCLLLLSGILFLWQATAFFWPVTRDLPSLPDSASPLPVVLIAHPDKNPRQLILETMPEADVKALAQVTPTTRAKPRRYPPKKSKPQLKPASIHLNSVTLAQLDLLPGVGPKLARRIIDYRQQHGPFQAIEDLKSVKGIGDKNYEKMSLYLAL